MTPIVGQPPKARAILLRSPPFPDPPPSEALDKQWHWAEFPGALSNWAAWPQIWTPWISFLSLIICVSQAGGRWTDLAAGCATGLLGSCLLAL